MKLKRKQKKEESKKISNRIKIINDSFTIDKKRQLINMIMK